jgi:hypothetical protein
VLEIFGKKDGDAKYLSRERWESLHSEGCGGVAGH